MKHFIIPMLLCIFLCLGSARAEKIQLDEEGESFYAGGLNQLDGKQYQTKEELKELEGILNTSGYVCWDELPKEERMLLESAEEHFWFEKYIWFPFSDNTKVYVNSNVFQKAVKELKDVWYLSYLTSDELQFSTVAVSYFGTNSLELYGTELDLMNEDLVRDMEYTFALGQQSTADYVTIQTPIDCVMRLDILGTGRYYVVAIKKNTPTRLLLLEQCYVSYINGVYVKNEKKKTTAFDNENVFDVTKIVEKYNIPSIDLKGYYTKPFGMSYDEWKKYYDNIPLGEGYTKPTWTEDGPIPPKEPELPEGWEEIFEEEDLGEPTEIGEVFKEYIPLYSTEQTGVITPPEDKPVVEEKKPSKWRTIIAIALCVFLIGFCGYLLFLRKDDTEEELSEEDEKEMEKFSDME